MDYVSPRLQDHHRSTMALGYTDPATGEFKKASSVQLRTNMRVNDDEAVRKACFEGAMAANQCKHGPDVSQM